MSQLAVPTTDNMAAPGFETNSHFEEVLRLKIYPIPMACCIFRIWIKACPGFRYSYFVRIDLSICFSRRNKLLVWENWFGRVCLTCCGWSVILLANQNSAYINGQNAHAWKIVPYFLGGSLLNVLLIEYTHISQTLTRPREFLASAFL